MLSLLILAPVLTLIQRLLAGCGNMVYRDHVLSGLCTKALENIMLKPSDSSLAAAISDPPERPPSAAREPPAADAPPGLAPAAG